MKKIKIVAFILCLCMVFVGCNMQNTPSSSLANEPLPTPVATSTLPPENRVTVAACGDNLIHGAIYNQAARRAIDKSYDFDFIYENVKGFLSANDLNIINQETLVNDKLPASTYPFFSTPGELGISAYNVGFRVFTQSNNHTYDLGADGLSATKEFWSNMPSDVVTTGIYDDETLYNIPTNTINGIKFAYLSYTQFTNGLPTPANSPYYVIYTSQTDIIEKQIKLARETADFVIVSVHWGNEDSHNITQGQTDLAQQFADFGADVIIGTHPHVIQSVSNLTSVDGRTVLCAYSLGNFVSAQAKPDQMLGYILKFDAVMNNGKKAIENILVCPTVNHFGKNHSNIQVYMLDDYTEEMALQHGVRIEYPFFNLEYINEVFSTYIPQEFL